MKDRIEIQERYSIEDCNNNPNKLYVFGDNLLGFGKGGQAIIRDCKNAFGIPTKRKPCGESNVFMKDDYPDSCTVQGKLYELLYRYKNGSNIVFPKDGLGTGLANLKEHAPKIYKLIDDFLKQYFEVDIQP